MSTKPLRFLILAIFATGASAQTPPPNDDEKKLINTLFQHQDIIAVNNVVSAEGFVPDNDPNTLQVVILTGPNARLGVSEDGEVVFLTTDVNTNMQARLTYEAFRRKAKRIMAVKVPPLPPQ